MRSVKRDAVCQVAYARELAEVRMAHKQERARLQQVRPGNRIWLRLAVVGQPWSKRVSKLERVAVRTLSSDMELGSCELRAGFRRARGSRRHPATCKHN